MASRPFDMGDTLEQLRLDLSNPSVDLLPPGVATDLFAPHALDEVVTLGWKYS